MLTPVKAIKGEHSVITQREKASRKLFSTTVSNDETVHRIIFQLAE